MPACRLLYILRGGYRGGAQEARPSIRFALNLPGLNLTQKRRKSGSKFGERCIYIRCLTKGCKFAAKWGIHHLCS